MYFNYLLDIIFFFIFALIEFFVFLKASGVTVSDACKTTYEEIKKDKKHRYVVFFIRDEKQIDVEFVGKLFFKNMFYLFYFLLLSTIHIIFILSSFLNYYFLFRLSRCSLRSIFGRPSKGWHWWMPLRALWLWVHAPVSGYFRGTLSILIF